jgi:hypothetical protein
MTNDTERLLTRLVALVGPDSAYQLFRALREQRPPQNGGATEAVALVAQVPEQEVDEAARYLRALLREAGEFGDL